MGMLSVNQANTNFHKTFLVRGANHPLKE